MPETITELVWVKVPYLITSDSKQARQEALEKLRGREEFSEWSSIAGWTISRSRLHATTLEESHVISISGG